jgi:hypothetical protein
MKQLFLLTLATIFGLQTASAQSYQDSGIFDHLGIGASVGTDGIGFDLASPITDYAALRAGVSFFPGIKGSGNVDIKDDDPELTPDVDIEVKMKMFDFKVLADLYPSKNSAFHFTLGAFFGNGTLASATNTSMFIKNPEKYGKLGLTIGDHRVTTDENGYANIDVKTNGFKPYIGIGFGRAVPKKNRVSVSFDMGVQFWGKPQLAADTKDDWGNVIYHKFKYSELNDDDDEDLKDALKTAEKITVFPVINLRISGRIF